MKHSLINFLEKQNLRLIGHQNLGIWIADSAVRLEEYFEPSSPWMSKFTEVKMGYGSSDSKDQKIENQFKVRCYNLVSDIIKFLKDQAPKV